jgi:hypothetical protein
MATPSAPNPISINDINVELGSPGTTLRSLDAAGVRTLAGPAFATPGTTISLNDLRGKSSFSVTGGNVSGLAPGNGYIYHTFTSPGNFTVTGSKSMEIFLVGGGGGGGLNGGAGAGQGGGGAGGLVYATNVPISSGTYSVTVGSGGATGTNGGDSTFHTFFTAKGGGGSSNASNGGGAGLNGGCGGGAGARSSAGSATQPTTPQAFPTVLNVGFNGGGGDGNDEAGGGGGTSAVGVPGGAGGAGRLMPQFLGPLIGVPSLPGNYGGGGGGGGVSGGAGGDYGGGSGASTSGSASPGLTNTGGGGGGSGRFAESAKPGGSGIVVIRYLAS